MHRQMIHQLREYEPALMHIPVLPASRLRQSVLAEGESRMRAVQIDDTPERLHYTFQLNGLRRYSEHGFRTLVVSDPPGLTP